MKSFLTGKIPVPGSFVPQVSTILNYVDLIGTMRVRLGIARNKYRVDPGLYAVGNLRDRCHTDFIAIYLFKIFFIKRLFFRDFNVPVTFCL